MSTKEVVFLLIPTAVIIFALLAFASNLDVRRAMVEGVLGKSRVHGSQHFMSPLEEFQNWAAPPILR
jgi:hypothetical protein